jgi:carboxynorspermidine decarboxylase
VVFNSLSQWQRFKEQCQAAATQRPIHFGLRINPEHSEGTVPLYDPCAPGSRLGIALAGKMDIDADGHVAAMQVPVRQ